MKVGLVDLAENVRLGGGDTWIKHVIKHWQGDIEHVKWRTPRRDARETILRGETYRVLRGNFAQRVAQLREYDYILLSNIYSQIAKMPDSYLAFLEANVPWSVMIHGQHESRKRGQGFTKELFDSPAFCGMVVATSRNFVPAFEEKIERELGVVELPYLPYDRQAGDSLPTREGLLSTCVMMSNKGIEAMIYGAMGSGYDLLFRGMYETARYGRHDMLVLERIKKALDLDWEVNVFEREPAWEYVLPSGEHIRYEGQYDDVAEGMSEGHVHLNLTSTAFCTDHLEYATLEALDYGLEAVVPGRQLISGHPYWLNEVPSYESPVKYDVNELRGAILVALNSSDRRREAYAQHNRDVLRRYHDPVDYVRNLQRGLGLDN